MIAKSSGSTVFSSLASGFWKIPLDKDKDAWVAVYMDNITVHARDMGEHNERLQKVVERLESAGLKLNT